MRVVEFINIANVVVDRHSISEQSFDLAKKLDSGQIQPSDLTPIKVVLNKGAYVLKDGRHRITAFKLVGLKQIKAKYHVD